MFLKYPLREAKESFEKNHPSVQVELIKAPEGYATRLLVSMMSHRTDMDLMFGATEATVAMWRARGFVLPWDDYIKSRPHMRRDAFLASFYDGFTLGGKQCALPISGEMWSFCVNKAMAREAGLLNAENNLRPARTWQEVFDYASRLTVRDEQGHVRVVGLAVNWTWPWSSVYAALKAEHGSILTGDPPQLVLDRPVVREMLRLTRQAVGDGTTTLASMTDVNQPRNDLKAGLVAMILTVHSRYLEAQETLGPGSTTIMPVPGRVGAISGGARSVVIPTGREVGDLARQFVEEEMLRPSFSAFAWENYGKLPCPKAVFDSLESSEAHWLADAAQHSPADPLFRDEMALFDAVKRNVQNYLTGRIELDRMFERLEGELERLDLLDVRRHFARTEAGS